MEVISTRNGVYHPVGDLNYRYSGVDFFRPYFDHQNGRIVCAQYMYVRATTLRNGWTDLDPERTWYKVVLTSRHFGWDNRVQVVDQDIVEYAPSEEVIKRFLEVPGVSAEELQALYKYLTWMKKLPEVSTKAIVLRQSAVSKDGGEHKTPVERKTVIDRREPDMLEQMLLDGGMMDPKSLETERIITLDHECNGMQVYSKRYRLYSQQLVASWAITQLKKFALWKDMRTGKTAAAYTAAQWALQHDEIDYVIVVCPVPNLYEPWADELEAEGWAVEVLDGTKQEDEDAILNMERGSAIVIGFERLRSRMSTMFEELNLERVFLIADETSAIKNPLSKRSMALRELAFECEYVTLLNGTPVEQGPQDLWAQNMCIDKYGGLWSPSFDQFQYNWLQSVGVNKYVVGAGLANEFEMLVQLCGMRCIRGEADQFTGKDKTFRHIEMKPTEEMFDQTNQVLDGLLCVTDADGNEQHVETSKAIIQKYGFLREIACGYGKFRYTEDSPYIRIRHEYDPKLLWIKAYMSANPTQPVVIYTLFNEQEERLKETLDSIGVRFSSLRKRMTLVKAFRLTSQFPNDAYKLLREHCIRMLRGNMYILRYQNLKRDLADAKDDPVRAGRTKVRIAELVKDSRFTAPYTCLQFFEQTQMSFGDTVFIPESVAYNQDVVDRAYNIGMRELLEQYEYYKDNGTYSGSEQKWQRDRFNRGESNVFICKMRQARGFSLARKEALANGIGVPPAIISMGPPWSLGSWEQALDRCVATDKDGKVYNTMVYSLSIKGTIEQMILKALRGKKNVQETILRDHDREGRNSFAENLMADMKAAMEEKGSGVFDHQEMLARELCGVPPTSRLKRTLILNKIKADPRYRQLIKDKTGKLTYASVEEWVATLEGKKRWARFVWAYTLLRSREQS